MKKYRFQFTRCLTDEYDGFNQIKIGRYWTVVATAETKNKSGNTVCELALQIHDKTKLYIKP